ncbi:hypothetical protein GQX73_g4668 [Xylaria multiplex]|uniref:Ribosomal RNA methyltransferase FtsJ domain-containing protein n=1 Tax=Xylaria multiplex TaxID=323545 RepID=A0A7C8MQG2_9PEZI|nr:hypothetical protein GQX73_g4668 [Xylaria multiplex]
MYKSFFHRLFAIPWLFFAVFACCLGSTATSDSTTALDEATVYPTKPSTRASHVSSPSDQNLSTEAIISIVALVSAVIIVPIVSKCATHWAVKRYRQSRISPTTIVSGIASQGQDRPRTALSTSSASLVNIEANVADSIQLLPLAHLGHPSSSRPVIIAELSDQLQDGSIHMTNQHESPSLQDTIYELEGTGVASGTGDTGRTRLVMLTGSFDSTHYFGNYTEVEPSLTFNTQGWQNPAGDQFFKNQRKRADDPNDRQASYFFNMMKRIAQELHSATDVFSIKTLDNVQPSILDWCMAPGGFLSAAMYHNRSARCRAFSLPAEDGGYKVQLSSKARITVDFLDLNLLAADMGANVIPPTHPEAASFLPSQLSPGDMFDLVICDGQSLRTHQRPQYREILESPRLALVQLALGLEHIRPGGKMIILMHRIESWRCVWLFHVFRKFSTVRVFKPMRDHAKRSSFYLVASNIQPRHKHAEEAVRMWKQAWRAATFGTEEAYRRLTQQPQAIIEEVLDSFGPEFINLATNVWETQAAALAQAPFIQTQSISFS